jgi:hypothetical protein
MMPATCAVSIRCLSTFWPVRRPVAQPAQQRDQLGVHVGDADLDRARPRRPGGTALDLALGRVEDLSMRCGWMPAVETSFSSVSRPTSRRTGSKQESSTGLGVSSMIRLTPVTDSNARMLRPSRPMIRPFISSAGRCSTLTTLSAVCSLATRWIASTTTARARVSAVARASFSMSRTSSAASRLACASIESISSVRAASAVSPAMRSISRR